MSDHYIFTRNHSFFKKRQNGLTLIEILVAMLMGLFLLAGLLQIFISTKQSYRVGEAMSRLQENARYAMQSIGRDVRQADYRECFATKNMSLYVLLKGTPANVDTHSAISGKEGVGNLPDALNLYWTNSACGINPVAMPRSYSIVTNNLIVNTVSNQVVQGVENMQVLYGIDTNGDGAPNYYVPYSSLNLPPSTVTPTLDQIMSVRVSLLLRTIDDNIASEPLSYTFPPWPVNGAMITVTPTDRRIRRVFTSTFALRNRLK